jgi:hypothetical protein
MMAERLIRFAALSYSLGSHERQLLERPFMSGRRGSHPNLEAIHSWVSTLPQGFAREHLSIVSVRVTALSTMLSLS